MIKSKKGRVQIKGKPSEVIADLVCVLKSCRRNFDSIGIDAEEIIKFAVETSSLSDEELREKENAGGDSIVEEN